MQSLLFPYSTSTSDKTDAVGKEDEEDYPDGSYPFPPFSGEMLEEKYPIL